MNEEIKKFLEKFLENFRDCGSCEGSGEDKNGDACRICGGTAIEVVSYGILFVELVPEARDLLKKGGA